MNTFARRALAAGAALLACVAMTAGTGTAAGAAETVGAVGAVGTTASGAAGAAPEVLDGPALAASWTGPLSTRGRYIVDASGARFKLRSGNWAGAQGTWQGSGPTTDPANNQAGQVSYNLPLGLDRAPIADILGGFHRLGINSIRLPFANALLHDRSTVPDVAVTANPQLRGKTPLQVFDAVVSALTADGFAVILNNHTTSYRFCCGLDGNERWNSGQSTQQWIDDWVFLADRYKDNKRVVGADLRNEVRRDTWDNPNWGLGDSHDQYAAFEEAGNRILRTDPDLLVIMEGINWYGIPAAGFSHGRPQLTPVRNLSNALIDSGKLVYSAHFYGYTGPANTGAASGSAGSTSDPRYQDFTPAQLAQVVNDEALFVTQSGQHFTAPVWISEFGAGGRGSTDAKEQAWFDNFTRILAANDTDFAVWPLVGWHTNGVPNDSWALLDFDTAGRPLSLEDPGDWRAPYWHRLINAPSYTGQVAPTPHWGLLDLDHADLDLSRRMLARPDWSPGNRKGNCPDGQRLVGLARSDGRGLCTDAGQPATGAGDWVTVTDERYVTHGDWASGYNKLQCPDGTFAVGYSVSSNAMSALLCTPATAALPTADRTLWFDHGDNRPATGGSSGSDWAPGYYKGQCGDNEYFAGVAFTWRWLHYGVPDAVLCRPLA
ncbi:cellulase family glycosylhydrolase [Streptomyces sp. NRRL S-495]|uniref:glycoside hydrolase family 5 protein n=1 Tax=Streptomyces sp. NRRL S-495 TaxID=1609133 RepID=UPI000AE3DFD4|nr:cellulase family glycosylhydrolase [Streptomyces sp. NRRL S-495]